MTEELKMAVSLLGIGMLTVFLVLFLVVVVGNLLINFVNKYVPAEEAALSTTKSKGIPPATIAAITAAVEMYTEGRGKITNIEKID